MSRIRLRKFRRKVRVNHKSKRKYIPIKVPEIMDLNENFESTVSFFLKLRDICDDDKKRFFLDFKQLKHKVAEKRLYIYQELSQARMRCYKRSHFPLVTRTIPNEILYFTSI